VIVVPIMIAMIADKEATKPRMHCGLVEDLTMTWLTLRYMCGTNDHGYVLLFVITRPSFPYS